MGTPELTTDQTQALERALAEFQSSNREELLTLAYPGIRDNALGGMLAGANPWETFLEWVKTKFHAACHEAGAFGSKVLVALQDYEFAHKVYLVSIVVAFLMHEMELSDIPIKELTAIALLIAAVLHRQPPNAGG